MSILPYLLYGSMEWNGNGMNAWRIQSGIAIYVRIAIWGHICHGMNAWRMSSIAICAWRIQSDIGRLIKNRD